MPDAFLFGRHQPGAASEGEPKGDERDWGIMGPQGERRIGDRLQDGSEKFPKLHGKAGEEDEDDEDDEAIGVRRRLLANKEDSEGFPSEEVGGRSAGEERADRDSTCTVHTGDCRVRAGW